MSLKLPCLLILFIISKISCLQAQILLVTDQSNLQVLPFVTIYSENPKAGTQSNAKGEADISAFKGAEKITLYCLNYKTLEISYAELEKKNFKIAMVEKSYDLNEIVVSASKFEEKRTDVPQQIQVIKAKDLAFMNQPTSADVLQQSGNVLVQKSQAGGGSPILRGFEANKVLLVIDGVRMNNAIYRGGHLQNILTVDNTLLDRVEVVFGPGSVVYGSDALGGVIHLHTKKPFLSSNGKLYFSGNAFTRYATAAQEKSAHLDFQMGLKKIAFLTSFTFSDFDDLRQGSTRNPFYGDWGKRFVYAERINGSDVETPNPDYNIQKQSGYRQYDFLQKIYFRQNDKINHTLNFQYSTSSDIDRYDRLTEIRNNRLRFAQWYYGPQKRLFSAYTLEMKGTKIYDGARFTFAYQDIEESRHDRNFGNPLLNRRIENVQVVSLNLDLSKQIKNHELRYGLEGVYNRVRSTAFTESVVDGITGGLNTRYPDGGSMMRTFAAYFTHTWELHPQWILNEGIRLSYVSLDATFKEKSFFPFPFDEANQQSGAVNGNLGLIYLPGNDWRFSLLVSTGFRAPNVDDIAKVFDSVGGNLIVPNPDLKPEYTYNAELNISKVIAKSIRLEGVGYYTWYRRVITTQPFLFDGQSQINFQGVNSRVLASVNASRAFLYGYSLNLAADLNDYIALNASLNYTYARIKTDSTDYPLDHIPPVFGKTGIQLNLKKLKSEFFVLYNGWKRLKDYNLVGEDNIQYATPLGMPAWVTLNLRTAWQIHPLIQLQVALENILDQNYRVFASGISGPGRNLALTLRGRW